jgi:methyl-accepting chemotaxis protein
MRRGLVGREGRISVRARLYGAFGAVVLAACAVIVLAVQGVSTLHDSQTQASRHAVPFLTGLSDAALAAKSAATDERGFLMTSQDSYRTEAVGRRDVEQAGLDTARAAATGTGQVQAVAGIGAALTTFNQALDQEFQLYPTDRARATSLAFGANRGLRKAYETAFTTAMNAAKASTAATAVASDRQASRLRLQLLALLGLTVLIGLIAALLLARAVSRPLNGAIAVLEKAASGDLGVRAQHVGAPEFRRMSQATNQMLTATGDALREIAGNARALNETATRLAAGSDTTTRAVTAAVEQANSVSSAAQQVSESVQSVASATEEMSATSAEIATSTSGAVQVANDAVTAASATQTIVGKLNNSSAEIGTVVRTITSIAEQTNLLALNATIEAARAGESGKGFAVVAGEVKDLAQETARATGDIARRVETIQADTQRAIEAISGIADVISKINEHQTTIATAVEEQSATTGEMTRSISEAATGAENIAGNIGVVADSVRTTLSHTRETSDAAQELATTSTQLQTLVGRFRF